MKNTKPGIIKVERISNHTYRTTVAIDFGNPDDATCNFTVTADKTDWSGQFDPFKYEEIILRQAQAAIGTRLSELAGDEHTD
ncbi:hypothetical protein K6W36_09075 [Acetobacter senegalensis]|uniref:hypothetical protein n=1 Tax=Acetobacter senegalensis TaxID=446692 RepID=UPI001EDBF97B|nr:hypothetical protein [Acetobacter senegalensis]MCG4260737.1 hypothetical protein [Acetobacter senegalensis]